MNRIYAHLIELPVTVRGVTIPDDDTGDYIVFINALFDHATQQAVLAHELEHIRRDHFSDTLTVIEAEAG